MEKLFYLYIILTSLLLFMAVIVLGGHTNNKAPLKERFFDFLNKMRVLYFPSLQRLYYSAKHNEWLATLNEDGGLYYYGGRYEYNSRTGQHEYVYHPELRTNKRSFMGGVEYTEWVSTDGIEPVTAHFGDLVLVLERYHKDSEYDGFTKGPDHEHGVFFNEGFNDHRMPKLKDRMDPWFYKVIGNLLTHIVPVLELIEKKKLSAA